MDNMVSLVSRSLRFQDGSTVAMDVATGDVKRFGDDPSFESDFLSCRVDPQRDGYLPIAYSLENTTPGFGIPSASFLMSFWPIQTFEDRYQFWDNAYGCDEPDTNEFTPNGYGFLDVTLQFDEGFRWDGQAALILVGYFGPNHPNGPGSPSPWDPQFSVKGTNISNLPVALP